MSSPMFVFNHKARIQILELLINEKQTQGELASYLSISSSEVSRHLSKLIENHFIDKTDRYFSISNYGITALKLFSSLKFYFEHTDYFKNHDINSLENQFLARLHTLEKSDFIQGAGFVMVKFSELFNLAEEEILIMTDQPFPFGKPVKRLKMILTDNFLELKLEVENQNIMKLSNIRFYEKLPVAMCIVDQKFGSIHFSFGKTIDFNFGFFSDQVEFIDLLMDIWNFYFDNGRQIMNE